MRSPMKLFVLLGLVLALASVSAQALPPQCDVACTCNSRCTQLCAIGSWVVNCGFEGICQDFCFAATASQSEAPSFLITEATSCDDQPLTELSAPAAEPAAELVSPALTSN